MSKKQIPILQEASTQREVAEYFGVSTRTVSEWKTQGMPIQPDGKFECGAIFRWWHQRHGGQTESDNKRASRLAKIEISEAQAQIAMGKAKALVETLVNAFLVRAYLDELLEFVRHRFTTVPTELSTSVPEPFRYDFLIDIEAKMDLVLRGIADWEKGLDEVVPPLPPGAKNPRRRHFKTKGK